MSKTHIHKLRRRSYKTGSSVFFCTGDDCTFKIGVEFSLGKKCLCWRCGNEMSLTPYSMRLAKPHCESCHKYKNPLPSRQDLLAEVNDKETDPLEDLRHQIDNLLNKEDDSEL